MNRGLEIGEIIPFSVWIISFPVCKTGFGNGKHFVKKVFYLKPKNKSNWAGQVDYSEKNIKDVTSLSVLYDKEDKYCQHQ